MDEFDTIIKLLCKFEDMKSLYRNPVFSLAILKIMDENTTKLIFDLIVSSTHISNLCDLLNVKESVNILIKLNLIVKNNDIVSLNNNFRTGLLEGFCNDKYCDRFTSNQECEFYNKSFDKSKIIDTSNFKINEIFEFIVNQNKKSAKYLKDVLLYSELINKAGEITNKGFEFLLNTNKIQLWFLIINFIKYFAKNKEDERDMLLDLMEICTKRKIEAFSLTRTHEWYTFLNSVGILYLLKNNIVFINNMCLFDKIYDESQQLLRKYIILETNYKIYAYTMKPYEKNILSLFSKIVYVFPNLIKAQFDETSLLCAFSKGITAKQILKYLEEFSKFVPPNIRNQILIWEAKQNRIKLTEGILYTDFLHLFDYLKLVKFLEAHNGILFQDKVKRIIIGTTELYEEVKEFIKNDINE